MKFTVLKPLTFDGKIRQKGETIELDDKNRRSAEALVKQGYLGKESPAKAGDKDKAPEEKTPGGPAK